MECLEFELFTNTEEESIIAPKDIIVYELEEEVELGFDTTKYLPKNFNPFEGMDSYNELLTEEALVLKTLVSNIEFANIIKIEDVVVYELEEEVELGFDTTKYLPKNFNPFEGMASYNELLTEEGLALKTLVNNTEFTNIIKIEDVVVYELEEEVELGFDTTQYLPKNFNPFDGMDSYNKLLTEEVLVLKTIVSNIEFANPVNIEDVVVCEFEEEDEIPLNSIL